MKIFNVRTGFATNSSSTHSIIFMPGARDREYDDDQCFGWENFVLASKEAKSAYLAQTIYRNMLNITTPEIAFTVAKDWIGTPPDPDGHVDHQSLISIPLRGKGIDKEFVEALKEHILQEGIVILGGNDNDEGAHPLDNGSSYRFANVDWMGVYTARYDKEYEYWSIFNRENGSKLRFTFGKGEAPQKSSAPELVDIKITDFCAANCPFCYQDSTKYGGHAPSYVLYQIAGALGELHCFEVALGGGEPMSYPNLELVMDGFRENDIVPNLTTKTTSWLSNNRKSRSILERAGAVAISVENGHEVHSVGKAIARYDLPVGKVVVQYVVGTGRESILRDVVVAAYREGISLTLLGFKRTGRGVTYSPVEVNWKKIIREESERGRIYRIGIDTVLANEITPEDEIPRWCYQKREGAFSMYIDATTMRCGPSSYCDESQMVKVKEFTPGVIQEVFRSF